MLNILLGIKSSYLFSWLHLNNFMILISILIQTTAHLGMENLFISRATHIHLSHPQAEGCEHHVRGYQEGHPLLQLLKLYEHTSSLDKPETRELYFWFTLVLSALIFEAEVWAACIHLQISFTFHLHFITFFSDLHRDSCDKNAYICHHARTTD